MKKNINHTIQWRWLLLLAFICLAVNPLFAEIPDSVGAKKIAENFFKIKSPNLRSSSTAMVLNKCYQSPSAKRSPVFVFQSSDKGFAVILQNKSQFAIAGYSPDGKFDVNNVPPQLLSLFAWYEDSLQIKSATSTTRAAGTPVMTPLLDEAGIHLNQFSHPEVGGCPTGCVATAFVQIMAYYKYPANGVGTHCYTHPKYGQLCADFGNTTYNWNNPTEEDYKKISFQVGVAMDMNYCGDAYGSSPGAENYEQVMHTYFKYYINNSITDSYYVRNEIDHRRPVYAELPGTPSHSVVLDGYDSDGLFHINFGWGGEYNGYYVLNNNSTFFAEYRFGTNLSGVTCLSPILLQTNAQDSLALVAIHNALGKTTGWDLTKPVSTWQGVLTLNGRVIELKLNNGVYATYKGTISSEIGNLSALQTLDLLGQFDGELPASIANLTELKMLFIDAGSGTLKAQLPQNIGNLVNLEILAIPQHAESNIPTSIGKLIKLQRLVLNSGNLTGDIPNEISNLKNLTYLNLQENKLTGNIPSGISQLTNLSEVYLNNNQLTGSIPTNIGNLINLKALTLNSNQLSGEIPTSIGNCIKIEQLKLNDNLLTGEIPSSIGNLSLVQWLNLSNNQFSSLPNNLDACNNIVELYLNKNKLTTLPISLNNLQNLEILNASENQISTLPKDFGATPALKQIDLSYNQLTEFPEQLCLLAKLEQINLRKNNIVAFPATITMLPSTINFLALDSNRIKGPIPKTLLENGNIIPLLLTDNCFTFEDIPQSSELKSGLGKQKPVEVSRKIFKTTIGDTLRIDIRKIAPFSLSTNVYNWISVDKNKAVSQTSDPILTVVIDEKNISNKYYCQVTNPSSPSYSFTMSGYNYVNPCLNVVNTDTISFQLVPDEELISEKYDGSYVVSSKLIPSKAIADRIVTLVPPLNVRGKVKWQASSDGKTWTDLSESMSQNDLKSNFIRVNENELVLSPQTPAFYRCSVQDVNCEPLLSDTIKVNPFGHVLYDETINVATQSKTVKVDSVEITLPEKICDKDFRLTIVKLDNPPAPPDSVKMGSTYDITVSFAETFDTPLFIKLKNIDKKIINGKDIEQIKAMYFDDKAHKWVYYDNSHISLKDSSLLFETNHLTIVAPAEMKKSQQENKNIWEYTETFQRNNILVYYRIGDIKTMNEKYEQMAQPWHNGNVPIYIQDITEYLSQVMETFKKTPNNLPVPSSTFSVYVKKMEDNDGVVGILGMLNHYLTINCDIKNPTRLRSLLAHEYMHFTQDYFISADPSNTFWMEANGHLSDRIVWDKSIIPVSESEQYLLDGRTASNSIYSFLANSWDYWDSSLLTQNFWGNIHYCYLAGTFLHYMRSYRDGEKLSPATLLKGTTWFGSWRNYLDSYIKKDLNSSIGNEYENFIKYILQGSNKNFTILSTSEGSNPYSYIIGESKYKKFSDKIVYKFEKNVQTPQNDKLTLNIPYLATKMLILYNSTPDRAVVVNYKRLHKPNENYKVYYGKYDFAQKQTVYVDISDSTDYNIFIEAHSVEATKEIKNMGFLLFIYKTNPSTLSWNNDFQASFELNATPVYDITNIYTAWIAGNNGNNLYIHTFSPSITWPVSISGVHLKDNVPNRISHSINYYTSDKTNITDSSYVVNVTFSDESIYSSGSEINGTYEVGKSIQLCNITQKIEYNFVKGCMKIQNHAIITNKFETTWEEKPRIVTNAIWYDDIMLSLKNMNTMGISASDNTVRFMTNNSSETQAAIDNLSMTHRVVSYDIYKEVQVSDETYHYEGTNYSSSNVILQIIFTIK